jgi:hypothetical protein
MSSPTQSALVLTGVFVAVHLINALAAQVNISAALLRGSEGKITVEPLVRRDDVVALTGAWFKGRRCQVQTETLSMRLGTAVLRLPRDDVAEMVLETGIVREQNGSGLIRISGTAGCPEDPVIARSVTLTGSSGNVGGMMLWASPAEPRQVIDVARRLVSTRRQADCETWGDLRSCPVDQFGENRTRILFGDPEHPMQSGVPLHAVCNGTTSGLFCAITESQSTGLGYRAFLRRAGESADLSEAEADVRGRIARYVETPRSTTTQAGL